MTSSGACTSHAQRHHLGTSPDFLRSRRDGVSAPASGAVHFQAVSDLPESGSRSRFRATVLVLEDDTALAHGIGEVLEREGFAIVYCSNTAEARQVMREATISALVMDLSLPGEFGGNLLAELVDLPDAPATVIVSGYALAGIIASRHGVELLVKPFTSDQLLTTVLRALRSGQRPKAAVEE